MTTLYLIDSKLRIKKQQAAAASHKRYRAVHFAFEEAFKTASGKTHFRCGCYAPNTPPEQLDAKLAAGWQAARKTSDETRVTCKVCLAQLNSRAPSSKRRRPPVLIRRRRSVGT